MKQCKFQEEVHFLGPAYEILLVIDEANKVTGQHEILVVFELDKYSTGKVLWGTAIGTFEHKTYFW